MIVEDRYTKGNTFQLIVGWRLLQQNTRVELPSCVKQTIRYASPDIKNTYMGHCCWAATKTRTNAVDIDREEI